MRFSWVFYCSGHLPFTVPLLLSQPSEQTDILITFIRLWLVLLLWLAVSRECCGKWTRETNVHSSALSWSTEAHYICIASRVDSAIKPRPLLLTNFRIIYNLTGLLSSMRTTILRKIMTIIISMPETLPQLLYLHKKINEWHADRAVIFWNIARIFRALVKWVCQRARLNGVRADGALSFFNGMRNCIFFYPLKCNAFEAGFHGWLRRVGFGDLIWTPPHLFSSFRWVKICSLIIVSAPEISINLKDLGK